MVQFSKDKCKVNIKLAINRLKFAQQKKTNGAKALRREVATLLETGKEESARIKVEHIIREDFLVEAFEILELFCDLLTARFGLIQTAGPCDEAIREAVETLIWAAPRADIKEMGEVRTQLIARFGKEFGVAASDNSSERVNPRLMHKLSVITPSPDLVNQYLLEIAKAHNLDYEPAPINGGVVNLYPAGAGGVSAAPDLMSLLEGLQQPKSPLDAPLPGSANPLIPMPSREFPDGMPPGGGAGAAPGGFDQGQYASFLAWQKQQEMAAVQAQAMQQQYGVTPLGVPSPSAPNAAAPHGLAPGGPGAVPPPAPSPHGLQPGGPGYVPPTNGVPHGLTPGGPQPRPTEHTNELAPGYRLMAGGIVPGNVMRPAEPTNTTPPVAHAPPPTQSPAAAPAQYGTSPPPAFTPAPAPMTSPYAQPGAPGAVPDDDLGLPSAPGSDPMGGAPGAPGGGEDAGVPDFDALEARFAALKRKR